MRSGRHLHATDHLAAGGARRCGCEPASPADQHRTAPEPPRTDWVPRRRQHVGFIRSHFIYSDRMVGLGA